MAVIQRWITELGLWPLILNINKRSIIDKKAYTSILRESGKSFLAVYYN